MASLCQMGSWLALFAGLAVVQAQTRTTSSAFWTYTSRYQYSLSTSKYTYIGGSVDTDVYTATRTIKSGVTPSATPAKTSADSYIYSNLQIIEAYYSDGAVGESDLSPTYDFSATRTTTTSKTSVLTVFRMPATYTAPASCPTQFTISMNETVTVPSQVRDQVTPVTVITGSASTFLTYGTTVTETWYLPTGAAPLETESADNYAYYVESCSTPFSWDIGDGKTSYRSGYGYGGYTSYRSGGGDDYNSYSGGYDDSVYCTLYGACTTLKTWIIVVATILPSLFFLGFLESWFWFRRLMLGKGALRFGTVCWICLSLWVACFTRTQSARSQDDQKLLREKWNNTSGGTAFKLWWKWGFRHAYPVPLLGQYSRNTVGIVPEGQPLPAPGMAQAPGAPPAQGPIYGPGFQPPPPGQHGIQPYYPPPQGWVPPPNGQTYYNGAQNGYYGEQGKENLSVTERTVSPPLPTTTQPSPAPHTGPTPPASVSPAPPHNMAEAPSPMSEPAQLADTQPPAHGGGAGAGEGGGHLPAPRPM